MDKQIFEVGQRVRTNQPSWHVDKGTTGIITRVDVARHVVGVALDGYTSKDWPLDFAVVELFPVVVEVEHEKILGTTSTVNDDVFITVKRIVRKSDNRRYAQAVRISRFNIDYMFVQVEEDILHEVAIND